MYSDNEIACQNSCSRLAASLILFELSSKISKTFSPFQKQRMFLEQSFASRVKEQAFCLASRSLMFFASNIYLDFRLSSKYVVVLGIDFDSILLW